MLIAKSLVQNDSQVWMTNSAPSLVDFYNMLLSVNAADSRLLIYVVNTCLLTESEG